MTRILISSYLLFFSILSFGQNESIENKISALDSAVEQLDEQEQFYEEKFLDSSDNLFHLKYIVEIQHKLPLKIYVNTNESSEVFVLYTNMFMVYNNSKNIDLVQLNRTGSKTSNFYFENDKLIFKSNTEESVDEKKLYEKIQTVKKMLKL